MRERPRRARNGREQSQQNLRLFDHLVGAAEEHQWNHYAKCLGSLLINHKFELRWLLDRNVGGVLTIENFVKKGRYLTMHVDVVDAVRHESPGLNIPLEGKHGGQALLDCERCRMRCACREMSRRQNQQHIW